MNIWICPGRPENIQMSIAQPHNGEFIWALNANRQPSFETLQTGDVCLFGNLKTGFRHLGFVREKRMLDHVEDDWPFHSPSGTPWTYAFTLDVRPIDLPADTARQLRGFEHSRQHWMSQTRLTPETGSEAFRAYLMQHYPEFFEHI